MLEHHTAPLLAYANYAVNTFLELLYCQPTLLLLKGTGPVTREFDVEGDGKCGFAGDAYMIFGIVKSSLLKFFFDP